MTWRHHIAGVLLLSHERQSEACATRLFPTRPHGILTLFYAAEVSQNRLQGVHKVTAKVRVPTCFRLYAYIHLYNVETRAYVGVGILPDIPPVGGPRRHCLGRALGFPG